MMWVTMGMDRNEFSGICGASSSNRLPDRTRNDVPPRLAVISLALALGLTAPGCAQVPAPRQRLVSKPNMEFSDSLVFNYQHKLLPQVEPGSAFAAGAQSTGCTSCK